MGSKMSSVDDRRSGSCPSSSTSSTTSAGAGVAGRPAARPGGDRAAPGSPVVHDRDARGRRATTDAAALVADDPGLLDVEVWRLFEVEGGGEDSLANHEKFFGDRWGAMFRDLAARDPTMRERLLDASLAALARDFSTYRAGWFSRFHESLAPTDDERARRADAYLGLLRSRVGPTVSLAVAALARIPQSDRLPPEDAPRADRAGPRGGPGRDGEGRARSRRPRRERVAGPRSTGRDRRGERPRQCLAGRPAGRDRPDRGLVGRARRGVARAVADRLPDVAASQRSAAAALIALLGGEPVAGSSTAAREPSRRGRYVSADRRSTQPRDRAGHVDRGARRCRRLGARDGGTRRRRRARAGCVGTLGADRPEQFARLTAPIAKRARTILARRESSPFTGFDPRADIAAVLLAWATGELVKPDTAHASVDPALEPSCPLARARSPQRSRAAIVRGRRRADPRRRLDRSGSARRAAAAAPAGVEARPCRGDPPAGSRWARRRARCGGRADRGGRRRRALRARWRRTDRPDRGMVGRGRARPSAGRGRRGGREAPLATRSGRRPGRPDPVAADRARRAVHDLDGARARDRTSTARPDAAWTSRPS